MEGIREYVLSVTAAAVLCGIANALTGSQGSFQAVMKLVSGLFLAFTVVSPLAKIRLEELTLFTGDIQLDAQAAAAYGEDYARSARRDIIKSQAEAYILDKAASLGAEVQVQIILSESDTPSSCQITGTLSPYLRIRLSQILEGELGIAKEDQQWENG